MLITSDDTDPEQYSPARRWENKQRNLRFIASNGVSLLKGARLFARCRSARQHLLFINGRSRSLSRKRASSSHDGQPRWRRGSIPPASGTAHLSSAGLLQKPLCSNRAWSDRSRRPSARSVNRDSYASEHLRSITAVHTVDTFNRALQIPGLPSPKQIDLQGPADRGSS